jgi:DNA-directed RNA polymerase specialized sigma subunit
MAREKELYFQKMESLLYKYMFIRQGIESMEEELNAEKNYDGVGSVDPGKENFKTNAFNSNVENAVIKRNESSKVKTLKSIIKSQKALIRKLDRAINKLSEEERKIIKFYYMDGLQWYKVSSEMNFCNEWCMKLRNRAIEKLAIAMAFAIVKIGDREKEVV